MKTLLSTLKASKETMKKQIEKTATVKGEDCWLFAPRNREGKVCLVAHIDTVWDGGQGFGRFGMIPSRSKSKKKAPEPEKLLLHDREQGLIWSPDGLGADDRAGVYAALKLFAETPEPYKPYILLTDYEESGGKGALEAASLFEELANCNFFIELDRANGNDAVFYNGEPEEFVDYIAEFGFKESIGSFSDISIVCPAMERCGVNLSVGYYHQHTEKEYLDVNKLQTTIDKVRNILKDNHAKGKVWELDTKDGDWKNWKDDWLNYGGLADLQGRGDEAGDGIIKCLMCGEGMFIEDLEYSQGYCETCGAFVLTVDGISISR